MKQVYSLPPIINHNAKILILGSMPGEESLRKQQYYAHPRNQFWSIIYTIFGHTPSANYNNRIAFLQAQNLALWDVIYTCSRKGSSDNTISSPSANNISELLEHYPNIRLIILNGTKATQIFVKQYQKNDSIHIPWIKVSSTSPIPGKHIKSLEEKIIEWKAAIASLDLSIPSK